MRTILYMAPIMGVTGYIYRNEYSRYFEGYDIAVTPFINNSTRRRSNLKDVFPENNRVKFELVPQLIDIRPQNFIIMARNLYDMGYKDINWNLGCPLPMVRKKKKGSGLLPYTDRILDFLDQVLPAIPNTLSIKVRLGSEGNTDLSKLLPGLNSLPIKEIIIHPRTGKQLYSGDADIRLFEECLSLTTHTIVYSGDIDSVEKFETLSKRFPAINRWMIGRGGITNPFLPERIKGIRNNTPEEDLERFLAFHESLLKSYQKELSGQAHLIGKMKEVWRYWVKAFENGDRLFLNISRTKTLKQYSATIDTFFKNNHLTHNKDNRNIFSLPL